MSNLNMLPVAELRTLFNLGVMIETGTEQGVGVKTGLNAGFQKVYSCEIIESRYKEAQNKFKNDERVILFSGESKVMLEVMLDLNQKDAALFWLDAHLPNCHSPNAGYNIDQILPLIDELKIIANHDRNCKEDVILIDDLCLINKEFREKDFDIQKWTHNKGIRDIAIDTIKNLFGNQTWFIDHRSEGVLIGLPNTPNKNLSSSLLDSLLNQYNWEKI